MALPDYIQVATSAAFVFGESAAADVTHALSLNNLSSGFARMSASADLGANFADEYCVYFRAETAITTAPTAGNTAELFLVSSHDGTTWPAFVTGADGTYPPSTQTGATLDQAARLLGPPVSVLVATAEADKVLRQAPTIWRPRGRYVVAVVRNALGVGFKNESPASLNDSRVLLVPRQVVVTEEV